jgi:hypothetical protein
MSSIAPDVPVSPAISPRHRLGAMLMLLGIALVATLFWAEVIRLVVNA